MQIRLSCDPFNITLDENQHPFCPNFEPESPLLSVLRGQFTFDQEGTENPGSYFSRAVHYPGGTMSGVTIGRGYDMGSRSSQQVLNDLFSAGVSREDAVLLSLGAGLRGSKANVFISTYCDSLPILSLQEQKNLFEKITYPYYEKDTIRLATKPDVVNIYGKTNWESLNQIIKDILIDLRYRGDYTPTTRQLIQTHVVNNDLLGFYKALSDQSFWKPGTAGHVPLHRFNQRVEYIKKALI